MKIIVAVKRVLDYNIKVRIKTDQSDVDLSNVKMSMNPFDEIAVEEALRLKEKGLATEIIVVSVGNAQSVETIRTALAMGADRGIHIRTEQNSPQPLAVAKILKYITLQEQADIVICGKQAIDDDYNQTGQMLSALLNAPQATFASQVTIQDNKIYVKREVDGGLQTIALNKPAVITTDLRLNEPRYASLPNIMKAKKKEIKEIPVEDLGIDMTPRFVMTKVSEPPKRSAGKKLSSVAELVGCLKQEGVI